MKLQIINEYFRWHSTIIPLLKHELWSSIEADSKSPRSRSSFDAKINYSGMERRGENMRYVFHARGKCFTTELNWVFNIDCGYFLFFYQFLMKEAAQESGLVTCASLKILHFCHFFVT